MNDFNVRRQWETLSAMKDGMRGPYTNVFSSPDGQIVLEDLRQRCFEYVPIFSTVPGETERNSGMHTVLKHIETMLTPVQDSAEPEADSSTP